MWETAGNATALDTRCRNPRRVSFIAEPRSSCSFNYLVGAGEQRGRHFEAERFGRLQIDDEFELGRKLDWHFGRVLALEDAAGIDTGLAKLICKTRSVAHQPAGIRKLTPMVQCRKRMARRQRDQLHATGDKQRLGTDQKGISLLFQQCRKGHIDFAIRAGVDDFDLPPMAEAAACNSVTKGLVINGLSGLTSTAKRATPGSSSCNSASRFAPSSTPMSLIPVALPPGRLRLAT